MCISANSKNRGLEVTQYGRRLVFEEIFNFRYFSIGQSQISDISTEQQQTRVLKMLIGGLRARCAWRRRTWLMPHGRNLNRAAKRALLYCLFGGCRASAGPSHQGPAPLRALYLAIIELIWGRRAFKMARGNSLFWRNALLSRCRRRAFLNAFPVCRICRHLEMTLGLR